jgi:hypothetical protein
MSGGLETVEEENTDIWQSQDHVTVNLIRTEAYRYDMRMNTGTRDSLPQIALGATRAGVQKPDILPWIWVCTFEEWSVESRPLRALTRRQTWEHYSPLEDFSIV